MSELENNLNPEVELEIEAEAESTIELEMEVDMGSTASEYNAEAWAVGKRHGVDVSSTDQTYHNNSKYYAEQAAQASTGGLIAPAYSASSTYALGDHVLHGGGLYECTTAITTAEEWTAAHWTQRVVGDELTDLNSAIDKKADCVYDTLSDQSLAHFEDGADGLPVDALTVGIEPVQDLNGQEYPFPHSASKNMFNKKTITEGRYFKEDGTIDTVSSCTISDYIPVEAESTYRSNAWSSAGYDRFLVFFDSNKTVISTLKLNKNGQTFETPAQCEFIRASIMNGYVDTFMITAGSEEQGDYQPYDNICPITGWTGVNIFRTDKNLLGGEVFRDAIKAYMPGANINTENKYIQFGAGETTVNTMDGRMIAPIYKILKPNTQYTFVLTYRKGTSTSSNMRISYTDDTVTDVPNVSATQTKETIVVVTSPGKKIRNLYKRNSSGTNTLYYDECGIFEGVLTAADFTPYVGNKYAFSFGETPGTVYGGTLNVKTGVLTVDRANIASYNGETLPGEWISDRDAYSAGGTPTTGAQVVYKLATPVTYNLTPTEVRTLLGENNLWANTGDVKTLVYPCDTKRYISKALSASQRIMELIVTANREDGMVASKAYESGDLLIVNGTMYKASTSIANGATLTVGTNVTETTVAAELAALAE